MVVVTTALNTFGDAHLSGMAFNKIKTMVMGYMNIRAGRATAII